MAVREHGEIKGIQGIAVQEDGTTMVSSADTVNIVGGGTVTDVGGVATINIPYGATWIREDVPAGSATYTFVNSPASSTSFLIFTDSGTLLFLGVDYTYDPTTETVTFLSLGANEAAYIWNAHASVQGGGIGDMVKAVYDPTNINSSAFDMDNFVDGTNKHYVSTSEKTKIANAVTGPASSTDGNIAVFDGATGKVIKDSGLNIQSTNDISDIPAGANICDVYYYNGTIYLFTGAVRDNIILES